MTTKNKGRIRHFAIAVQDPWAAAEFYKETFGLEELGESDGKLAEGVYLTDGVINLALLRFKSDEAAQGTGKDFEGLHHVGFWVDDAIAAGAAGFLAPVVASEVAELSLSERQGILKFLSAHIQQRVPLIVGASADDPQTCRDLAVMAQELDAAAWLVAVPQSIYQNLDRVVSYFHDVCCECKLPLIIQDLQFGGPAYR